MNAEQFCAEYGHECKNGRISFTKKVVDRFITTYTYFEPKDLTIENRKRLIAFVMIGLHRIGYSKYYNIKDNEIEKIELPQSIFS